MKVETLSTSVVRQTQVAATGEGGSNVSGTPKGIAGAATLESQLAAANARVAELEARLARFTPLFDPPVGCPSPE